MERTDDESQALCPVCGGPARDIQFPVDTRIDHTAEPITIRAITIRACEDTACDAFHPAALQDI